jgi:hypothetical protein
MDHLTTVYKHKCEQLQEQLNNFQRMLNEAPPPGVIRRIPDADVSGGPGPGRIPRPNGQGVNPTGYGRNNPTIDPTEIARREAVEAARLAALAWKRLVKPVTRLARDISGPDLTDWLARMTPDELKAYLYNHSEAREWIFNGQTYIQRLWQGRVETWDAATGTWRFDMFYDLGATGYPIPSSFGDHYLLNIPVRVEKYIEPANIDVTTLTPINPNATTINPNATTIGN